MDWKLTSTPNFKELRVIIYLNLIILLLKCSWWKMKFQGKHNYKQEWQTAGNVHLTTGSFCEMHSLQHSTNDSVIQVHFIVNYKQESIMERALVKVTCASINQSKTFKTDFGHLTSLHEETIFSQQSGESVIELIYREQIPS